MDQPSPRRRGAPKGNRNAVKHGFYSRLGRDEKRSSLPSAEIYLQPDLALFRALLARVTASLASGEVPPTTFTENLAVLHLVCIAVARINSLWHSNRRLYKEGAQTFLDAFKSFGFTEDQLQPEIFFTSKNRRGAQPGNTNALGNGLYAFPLSTAEIQRLQNKDFLSANSELNLIRVLLLRTAISMRNAEHLGFAMHMRALRVFTLATTIIEKMERRKMPIFSGSQRFEDLVDYIIRDLSEKPEK